MTTRSWTISLILLTALVIVLAAALVIIPAKQSQTATSTPQTATSTQTGTTTGTGTTATTTQPLSKRVVVTAPAKNATVTSTFTVAGNAPGPWFFEAVFPIKVLDKNGNTIATAQGQAQGDWMTTGQVTFTAQVSISGYKGPATLVLSKDNPSGLPQNDDSVSIPITIQ